MLSIFISSHLVKSKQNQQYFIKFEHLSLLPTRLILSTFISRMTEQKIDDDENETGTFLPIFYYRFSSFFFLVFHRKFYCRKINFVFFSSNLFWLDQKPFRFIFQEFLKSLIQLKTNNGRIYHPKSKKNILNYNSISSSR